MKQELGKKNCLYPMPTTLIGATINGKPNFVTIAHVGIMGMEIVSISMSKKRYTSIGIKENRTFSVNIPSRKMMKETDYCGLVSGKTADKSLLFATFYGKLKTAPMINACPVNMECRVLQSLEFGTHEVFIGDIVSTYCDDAVLTDGEPDFKKIDPILFTMHDQGYWTIGERIATAWDVGKELQKQHGSADRITRVFFYP